MKTAVGILTLLGILAAGSAALVMQALKPARETPMVRVLMVQGDLPAMTRLTAEEIKLEMVPRAALPKGCLIDPSQVIGRILSVPLMKGQLVTESSLVPRGAAAEKMMTLPPGMGVATVAVPSRSVNGGLLYPGCFVDVLAAIQEGSGSRAPLVSGTLFKAMQVWSLGDETGGPVPVEQEEKAKKRPPSGSGTIKVNLLVNEEQAKILQVVAERGSVTLMIRNPREAAQAGPQTELVADEGLRRALGLVPEEPNSMEAAVVQEAPEDVNESKPAPPPKPPRIVQVILGSNVKDEVFPPKDEENEKDQ
jgi:pilus assembly protein CpaB